MCVCVCVCVCVCEQGQEVSEDEGGGASLARDLSGHTDTVFDVAWLHPGSLAYKMGARLMSASHDLTVRAWGLSVTESPRSGDI